MQLSYRGRHYTHESTPVEMIESGLTGTYRGQSFPITYPRHIPVPQSSHELVYRGVAYRTSTTGSAVPVERKRPAVAVQTKPMVAPSCLIEKRSRRVSLTSYETVHRSNIQRRLQQRIEAAKAHGDQRLLNLLERELQQAG